MWADALTKEMEVHDHMREHFEKESLKVRNEGINKVKCINEEIKMINI